MLTTTQVRNLKARGNPYRVADIGHEEQDGVCTGLAVHISAKGHKSFVLAKKVDGKRRFFKLGDVGILKLAQARINGKELKKQLAQGIMPGEEKKQEIVGTVQDLCDAYLLHLKQKGSKSAKAAKIILEKDGIKTVKNKQANTITSEELADIIRVVVQRGALTHATHTRAYLHAMFAYGMGADLDTTSATNGTRFKLKFNPVSAIPKPKKGTTALDRFLSEKEVKKIWNELNKHSPLIGAALKLQLCTGQRVREVLGLKWDDIEVVNGEAVWFLKDTKNGKPHSVVLNKIALQVLCDLYKHTSHCEIAFPKRHATTEVMTDTTLSQFIRKQSDKVKMERFAPRDLRRTFKTLAIKNGLPKQELDIVQNHAMNDISSKHYNKYDYLKEKAEIMNQWNKILENILE